MAWPDARGHFGPYGGRYVAETLVPPLEELTVAWEAALILVGISSKNLA